MGLLDLDYADLVLPNKGAELMGRTTSKFLLGWTIHGCYLDPLVDTGLPVAGVRAPRHR